MQSINLILFTVTAQPHTTKDHAVSWGGFKHFGCTCFPISRSTGTFCKKRQVFWNVTPCQHVNTDTAHVLTKISLRKFHLKLIYRNVIKVSFQTELLYFTEETSFRSFCKGKTLFQPLWPDEQCVFHLISYVPPTTNSTYNQAFKMYLVRKSGSTCS